MYAGLGTLLLHVPDELREWTVRSPVGDLDGLPEYDVLPKYIRLGASAIPRKAVEPRTTAGRLVPISSSIAARARDNRGTLPYF